MLFQLVINQKFQVKQEVNVWTLVFKFNIHKTLYFLCYFPQTHCNLYIYIFFFKLVFESRILVLILSSVTFSLQLATFRFLATF